MLLYEKLIAEGILLLILTIVLMVYYFKNNDGNDGDKPKLC